MTELIDNNSIAKNIPNIDNELFNALSDKEKLEVLKILEEVANTGYSARFDELTYDDYKEIPVDIVTFILDRKYLGNAWHLADGKCKLFPFWRNFYQKIFPSNIEVSVNNVLLSGARGLGKSECAVTAGLYQMYKLMCLKDPFLTFNLKPSEKFAFAFMNITEELAMDIGVSKFQATVQMSPWFMERGTLSGKNNIVWNPPNYINIIIGSQPRHVIGQPIFFFFMDEISFIPNQDIEMQKVKARDLLDTAIGGMKTRFFYKGKNYGLGILASSKRSEKSFLEEHMKKKLETEKENVLIVDEPVWNVRPPEEFSGKRFIVAVGNKFVASQIVPTGAALQPYIEKGCRIIEVPVEYESNFKEDIDRALCDYAGISSSDLTKYIAGFRLQAVKHDDFKNPFSQDIIEVGNAPEDIVQYKDFFNLDLIPPKFKSKPMYIHLDMSLTGDKTGIAGVWVLGKRPPKEGETSSQELMYRVAFSVSIKAPRGFQISFEKNRQFIYWLREQGFNIKGVSSDTFQSADLAQQMQAKKFNYTIISVDRVDTMDDGVTKLCRPYHYLRNTIYEERIQTYYSELLFTELLQLERASNGKIDHPDTQNASKDAADAVCAAVWNASQHADEFNFECGETIDAITQTNQNQDEALKRQITVDFEKELQNLYNIKSIRDAANREQQKREQDSNYQSLAYLQQGIVIL